MRTEQLRYFKEIVNCGSISAAAEKFYTKQSTLSYALKALEEELGEKLVIRKNNGVVLSPFGEEIYPYIDRLLNYSEYIINYSKNKTEQLNNFFINITPQTSTLFSNVLYRNLKHKYSNIRIHVSETFSNTLITNIAKHRSDLAIAICNTKSVEYKTTLAKNSAIHFEPLFNAQMGVLYHHNSPLNTHNNITRGTLKDVHMLLVDGLVRPNNTGAIDIAAYNKSFNNLDCFPNYQSIFDILQNDIYAATLITDIMINEQISSKNNILKYSPLYPLDDEKMCVYALYRKDDVNPLIYESIDLLRNFSAVI